jgi:DNA-binding transcriptional ArsR family regulator
MLDDDLRLENQLCFALYAATHAITRTYRGKLGELGLTYPQYLVLLALLEQPMMTSGALARALKLDAGTLTPLLKRLATAGLVARERRAQDERVVEISLTPAGRPGHVGVAACAAGFDRESGHGRGWCARTDVTVVSTCRRAARCRFNERFS